MNKFYIYFITLSIVGSLNVEGLFTEHNEPLIISPRRESCIEMDPIELLGEWDCEDEVPMTNDEWSEEE